MSASPSRAPYACAAQLAEENETFKHAYRLTIETIQPEDVALFDKPVVLHIIISGKPLVMDGSGTAPPSSSPSRSGTLRRQADGAFSEMRGDAHFVRRGILRRRRKR